MLLIPCPWCGPRNQIEFTYGGDATLRRPAPDAPEAAWVDYVYLRDNPCGPHRRALVPRRRLPQLVQGPPRHAHARHPRAARRPTDRRRRRRGRASDDAAHGASRSRRRRSTARVRSRSTSTARATKAIAGDTLASALLANGVHLVGRSFKYHRPRGIYSAGAEEPNALVQLARGARSEPNTRATTLELYDGLIARSQNCWPSVRFDVGRDRQRAVAAAARRLLLQDVHVAADAAAGGCATSTSSAARPAWGAPPSAPDPDRYEHQYAHCDVLVIGGGPAGLAAARTAAGAGARVIVCQQSPRFGGALSSAPMRRSVDGARAATGPNACVGRACRASRTSRCCRARRPSATTTTISSARSSASTDHLPASRRRILPRQRMWMIRAQAVVLASGAIERGIAYANNDLPGTLLAGAARTYVTRYGVRARHARGRVHEQRRGLRGGARAARRGRRHRRDRRCASRVAARGRAAARARAAGLAAARRRRSSRARTGGLRVSRRRRRRRATGGAATSLDCDLVAVSGGYSPAVHLFSQARGTLRYDDARASFLPDASPHADRAGRRGERSLQRRSRDRRWRSGRRGAALARAGFAITPASRPVRAVAGDDRRRDACRRAAVGRRRRARRASASSTCRTTSPSRDIALAAREGYQVGRASEALHDARHGHRPGQDEQRHRACADGRATRRADSAGRHDDVPSAVHAGDARRVARPRARRARRADALHGDARVARGAGRALRQCGAVEAPAFVSARRRIGGRRGDCARRATCARTSASSTCRRSARSSCRDATSPNS